MDVKRQAFFERQVTPSSEVFTRSLKIKLLRHSGRDRSQTRGRENDDGNGGLTRCVSTEENRGSMFPIAIIQSQHTVLAVLQ